MRDLGPKFARFWAATTVSALGDGLMAVGLPLLAREMTERPFLIATVFAAGRAPWLFAIIVGALVDRRDARNVLVSMDAIRAVALAALGWYLISSDRLPPIAVVYALAMFLALCSIAFFAAVQRVIPSLVETSKLERANGYIQSGINTGEQFVGPAMGAYFATGGQIPIIGDAISFAASGLVLSRLPHIPPTPTEVRTLRDDVAIGWTWFLSSATIQTLTLGSALLAGFTALVLATEVVIVRDTLGLGTYWFGPFTALLAGGAISGGVVASRIIATLRSTTFTITTALSALTYLACIGARSPVLVFTALTIQCFTVGVNNVSSASIRQRAVPSELRGRVISMLRSFVWGLQIPGALLGGWIAGRWGTDTMFAVAGMGLLVTALITARPLRRLLAPYQAPPGVATQSPLTA